MQFEVAAEFVRCGNMPLKNIVREFKGMKNGIGSKSKRGGDSKHWLCRSKSHVAPDVTPFEPIQQGQWASLPPELLLDIIRRVEESETSWPARAVVVFCASVCKSWRSVTKEIIKTPQQCGRITFPISLKQVINYSLYFLVESKLFLNLGRFMFLMFSFVMNSPVPVIVQYSALLGGTGKVLHSCCT